MFFKVNKETPTTQQETNPPMPAASSTGSFSSSEDAAPLTTRTFRLASMFLDDDFACRFAEEEEEEKRKRVCDWETEEIEDNAIRCIYILFVRVCFSRRVSPRRMRLFLFARAEGNPPPVSDIRYTFCNERKEERINIGFQNSKP